MKLDQKVDLDKSLASTLYRQYASQSRRSFLYRLTKASFSFLGVAIVGEVSLFRIPKARGEQFDSNGVWQDTAPFFIVPDPVPWNYCGLDGADCSTCGASQTLQTGTSWVQCCQKPEDPCPLWYCCSYTDVCAQQTTPPSQLTPSGCKGNGNGKSSIWCAPGQSYDIQPYVCTVVNCAPTGFENAEDCGNSACPGNIDPATGLPANPLLGPPYTCADQGGR